MEKRTDHIPRLCPKCDGPLTADKVCTKCKKEPKKLKLLQGFVSYG